MLTDATGIPLAISLTGGHRDDVTQLLPLIDVCDRSHRANPALIASASATNVRRPDHEDPTRRRPQPRSQAAKQINPNLKPRPRHRRRTLRALARELACVCWEAAAID